MEYGNTNMGGSQQIYVSQSQEPPRVSGCNPQHLANTFPGVDCNSSSRNYGPYSQPYQANEYSASHNSHIGGPPGVYQQSFSGEAHGQNLTLNQLLQQNSSSSTYQVRPVNNSQPVYRGYDPYSYTYKPGAPSCAAQGRTQANTYSFSGAQRFADPYTRSYLPYPPGPHYPYYPHSQSLIQRSRAPQPPGLDYANINSCNQSRPPQPTPSGGSTPNQIERPPSRNVSYVNSSSHAAFQNAQLSSPVYSSGSQPSSWSPHTAPFGSPQHIQSQPRPRSLSRDYQLKINEVPSESPNANNSSTNNAATRSDNQSEGTPSTFEETGCRPQSRLSETGVSSTPKSVTSSVKDQSDVPNTAPSVETVVQNPGTDGTPQPQVSTPSTIISSLSVSPLSVVSRETSPAQSYPSFMQTSVSSSSPMTSQVGNIQGQPATCPSPGQSKGPHQNSRTAPSPRPYGVVNQEMGIPRMPYPSYPHPQAPPNSPYSVSGRPPGYPAGYPLRPPSIHSATSVPSCVPGRPQFQPQSSVGPTSTSSMPPPLTLPSSSLSSNQSTACDNSGPSQTTFTQVQPYSTPMSSASTNYGTSGSAYGPHPSWDQEISYQPPHPSSAFHPQFGGRPPYLGPTDRGVGYPPSASVPNSNASNSMAHNGQNLQPSSAGPYPHNQSLSYPSHHTQYPYSQSQMAYHPQSQYNHPYSPGPGGPILQQQQHPQHMVAPTSAVASNYSSPMLNNSSPLPQHIQNSREGFHMQYPHDGQHPPVSSSNESFVSTGFPQNGGSPGVVRPSSMINAISKANLVSGKMGKNDLPTRPVSSGCPTPISSSSQIMNANQSGVASGEPNSVSVPQHYQHRLASQSSHPQIQQYPEVGNYPPGLGSGSFGPQCGAPGSSGEVLQGPSFQGFQQQYHSPSNSLIPSQQPQNVAISASNQSSFYSTDGAHSNVGSIHQSLSSISSQSLSGFQKLLEMGNEPERRPWLENYIRFMDDIGKPVVGIPQVVKQPLDLYRFYVAVRERGGVAEVIKARRWKEISQAIGISASASAAYALRKNYCKLLLDYECRFDRGGIDPRPLLAHIENQSGKKRRCSSIDGDPNSLSGDLPPPAPPSPTGSHSSASSSLLPPGSSGASLSGGPSGTAGSAASDSQLGPPSSQHQRFSDHGQPGSVSTVPESPSCIPNAPSPPGLSGQSSTSYMPSSGPTPTNIPSPQRPSSCTAINGYPNASVSTSDSSCCPWPWTPENSNSETVTHQSPSASEPSTTMPGVVLVTRESTSSQYTQSRIPSGSLPSNNNIPPASSMYAGVSNSSCTSSTPSGNIEVIAQHNFNPYLTHGPPFVSNPSHPMINQHHVPPPQAIEHPFPGSQPHMYPRHPSNHSFRTPSFNPAAPPSAVSGDSIALLRMHQLRPGAPQMQPYIPGGAVPPFCGSVNNNNTNLNHSSPIPPHLLHHSQRPGYVTTILKRLDHYTFPPGSVEATPVDSPRRRRYRTKDLGPIAPFKLLMALRSGLTAEVSWALNCLNILLRDENGIDLIVPSALPGLLTSLVDIWRHTLGELFDHDLFITSLELPTDLTVIPSANTDTKHDLVLKNVRNNYSSNLKTNLSYLDVKGKSYLNDETSSTSLIQLEREIGRIAAIKDVPLSSVRVGLRRLLHKCNNSRSLHPPVRLRNGLMLRVENFPTMSSVAVNLSTSCNSSSRSVDTSTPVSSLSSRSRKRGKHLLFSSTTPNYMSGSSNITSEQLHTNMSSNINISNAVSKSDGIMVWSTPQITSIVDSLRAPEAYSNLRDLALYVIDTLLESRNNHPPETSETCSASQTSDQLNPTKPTITTKSSSSVLRCLMEKGGGDTTCHIMPPFGAHAFQSSHWVNHQESGSLHGDDDHLPNLTECSSALSPVVDATIKQTVSITELNDELIKISELEDDQPHGKRMRHSSSSSLPCPTLSPQPICDVVSEETDCKLIESHDANSDCVISSSCDDNDDELEFTQLIDESGRCPLRAREELVHHGVICLWPDHDKASSYEARAVRCLCVSTVLRNLSFMNTVERHLSNQKGVLALIGRLILFGHEHIGKNDTWQAVEDKSHALESSYCAWWTPTWLEDMRENAMVLLVNVAGYLELVHFDESIVRPILEGLLHWITCSTSASVDPFPGHRTLSPRRLALEALNRLCVHETNVDLLLSTPSDEKVLSNLFDRLATWLAVPEDQVTRELALSTMHYLAGGGASFSTSVSSSIGKSSSETNASTSTYIGTTMLAGAKPSPISGLLAFIEAAEATTRRVIDQYGVQALQERPELMGTSLEMVRRAGALLDRLAVDSKGRVSFTPDLELRLMDLVTSRVLDATVAHLLCGALHRLLPDCDCPISHIKVSTVPPIPSPSVVAELLKQSVNTRESINQVAKEHSNKDVGKADSSPEVVSSEKSTDVTGSESHCKRSATDGSKDSESNKTGSFTTTEDVKKVAYDIDESVDKRVVISCMNPPIDKNPVFQDSCIKEKKMNGSVNAACDVHCKTETPDLQNNSVNDLGVYCNNTDSQSKTNCMDCP